MRSLLITGTDTGVGKTVVACGISTALVRLGYRVAPFKPAETGCERNAHTGELIPADALQLQRASGTTASLGSICPIRFQTPVAPAVAADMEGQPLTVESVTQRLTESFHTLAASHDFVVVETAGGIMVPLAWGFHYGDLAKLLKLPVLLVAGSKLGVLNHTLLTMEYLARTGLKIVGCVVNHHSQDRTPATDTNIAAFRKLLSVPVFVLPYQSGGQGSANRDFDEMARYIADSGALL